MQFWRFLYDVLGTYRFTVIGTYLTLFSKVFSKIFSTVFFSSSQFFSVFPGFSNFFQFFSGFFPQKVRFFPIHPFLFWKPYFCPTYSILIPIISVWSKICNFYSKRFFLSKLLFAFILIFLSEIQIFPSKVSLCFWKTVTYSKRIVWTQVLFVLSLSCTVFFSCNLCSTYVRLTFEMNYTLHVSLCCLRDQQSRIFWNENIDKFLLCIHTIFGSMYKNTWCIAQTARKWFSFSSAVGQGIMEESILHCHWARKPIKSRQVTIVIWLFTTY